MDQNVPARAATGEPGVSAGRIRRGALAVWRGFAAVVFVLASLLVVLGVLLTIVGVVLGFTEGEWVTAAAWAGGTAVLWLLTWGAHRCTGPRFRRATGTAGDVLELLDVILLPVRVFGVIGRLLD